MTRRAPGANLRLLGTLGMIGGLSYFLGGVRMLVFATGEDRLTDIFGIIWALGWIAGGWGLRELRVTGPSVFARAVSTALVAGFALAAMWGIHRVIVLKAADVGPFAVAPLIVVLGMIATGVMSLHASPWPGWRRVLPLFIAVVYVTAVVITGVTAMVTLPHTFAINGLAYVLLGDAIRVSSR